jgi:hypothetical protein
MLKPRSRAITPCWEWRGVPGEVAWPCFVMPLGSSSISSSQSPIVIAETRWKAEGVWWHWNRASRLRRRSCAAEQPSLCIPCPPGPDPLPTCRHLCFPSRSQLLAGAWPVGMDIDLHMVPPSLTQPHPVIPGDVKVLPSPARWLEETRRTSRCVSLSLASLARAPCDPPH